MTSPRGPVRWLHALGLGRPRPDESVGLEIEHHLAELTDRLVAEGWAPADARREAERRFGDARRYAPSMRRTEQAILAAERLAGGWDLVRQSVRSTARTIRRSPGFAAAVVLTLGLGIGANATMYGIVDRLLLRPPEHVVDAEDVVRVFVESPSRLTGGTFFGSSIAYPDYTDLKAHSGFAAVAAFTGASERTVGGGPTASRARVALASAEFFPLLGVSPAIGRFYTLEEAAPGSNPTAVLGGDYWRRAYGADPDVVGRTIEIGGRSHTIIGVTPAAFTGVDLTAVDIWLPLELTQALASTSSVDCLLSRGCYWLRAVARLGDDVSRDAAEAEATRLHLAGRSDEIERRRSYRQAKVVLASIIAARGPNASAESRVARWLTGVSLIVLLIACANVANLLMARGTKLRRELGVRLALGAARRRVVAQTILESVLLALAGGALAIALAAWGGDVLRSALLPNVYFPGSALTGRLLVFTLIAAIATGLFAGVAPALQGSRVELAGTLGGGAFGSSAARSRLRGFLTVSQAAMCVLLLVGAGLFVRSLGEVRASDLGLDVDHVLMAPIEFRTSELDPTRQTELYEEAMRRVTMLPGVRSAAATSMGFQSAYAATFRVPGLDSFPRLPGGGPYEYPVSARYFETVGLAITRGRAIDAAEIADGSRVAVVNETMARMLWPEGDAVGQCVVYGDVDTCASVVGVAEDAARGGFRDAPFMAVYYPAGHSDLGYRSMYVRAEGRPEDIAGDVASLLRSFSPDVRYADVRSLREILDPQARSWTLGATMFTVFGLLALFVAAVGLYSVLAFDVAQRTREIGIRSALGARKARLLGSVVVQGTSMGALGVALGLGVAYVAAPYAAELLFEVSPRDPAVFAGVGLVLIVVSVVAALHPALRATRVDPVTALRAE